MEPADNPCPQDGSPMLGYQLDGVELDSCARCGGTWLDAGEIEMIADMSGVAPGPLSAALRATRGRRRSDRRCPRCGARLDAVVLRGRGEPVEVDRCPRGHGLFLDPGEMAAVVAAFDEGEGAAVGGLLADLFGSRTAGCGPGGGE
ncbi:MAG: zf-TFIIB domain-containing protein [Deltaproteobacteria bacterium]|nr:zf-TFIIB domain-containing protein [Deltaproteobacteria bacterium]